MPILEFLQNADSTRIGDIHALLCELIKQLWKTLRQLPKMLNIPLPYDPEILLLTIYPREMNTYVHTKTWT